MTPKPDAATGRAARLVEQMRANLRKRKDQARQRRSGEAGEALSRAAVPVSDASGEDQPGESPVGRRLGSGGA